MHSLYDVSRTYVPCVESERGAALPRKVACPGNLVDSSQMAFLFNVLSSNDPEFGGPRTTRKECCSIARADSALGLDSDRGELPRRPISSRFNLTGNLLT